MPTTRRGIAAGMLGLGAHLATRSAGAQTSRWPERPPARVAASGSETSSTAAIFASTVSPRKIEVSCGR